MTRSSTRLHRWFPTRNGVTLVETATMGACTTAVLVMVLPTLSEMRRQAKEVRCLANLGQIGDANAIYAATDRNELAIPTHRLLGLLPSPVGEYEWGGKSGVGQPVTGSSPLNSKWGTQYGRGPASRKLNQIIYGHHFPNFLDNPGPNQQHWLADTQLDLPVYRCPGDHGYAGHHYSSFKTSKLTSYDHYGNSYAANTMWLGIAGGSCTLSSNSPFLRPVSEVPAPSRTYAYIENAGFFAWRKNYGDDGCSVGGPTGGDVESVTTGWHGQPFIFSVAFVDGHSARVFIKGHTQPQPDLGRYPDFAGIPRDYSFYQCVIIRGGGWQMDTLPAPPVRTSFSCSAGGPIDPIVFAPNNSRSTSAIEFFAPEQEGEE